MPQSATASAQGICQRLRRGFIASVFAAILALSARVSLAQDQPQAGSGKTLSGEEIYQKVLPSTMTLSVLTKDGLVKTGTGFMAIRDGMAVTAWHVVKNAQHVVAKFSNGEEFEASGLVDKDEVRDVALIRIKVFGRPALSIQTREPAIGSKTYAIGAPKGLEFSFSDGIVSGIRTLEGFKNIQFTCAVSPGNSGGPLVDGNSDVVGVVDWQFRDGQNLNFAVPTTYAMALDASLPTQPWENVKESPAIAAEGGSSGQTSVTNEQFDKLLAETVIDLHDIAFSNQYVWSKVIRERFGFQDGIPVFALAAATNAGKKLDELKRTIPPDSTREHQKQYFAAQMEGEVAVALKFQSAVKIAQRNRGFTPEANDELKEGLVQQRAEIKPLSTEDKVAMKKSKSLVENLPEDDRISLDLEDKKSRFVLGVDGLSRQPMLFLLFTEDSLAKKLGFKEGDTLIGIGEKSFPSVEAFRLFLASHSGEKMKAIVLRDGEQKEIELKIPAGLPQ